MNSRGLLEQLLNAERSWENADRLYIIPRAAALNARASSASDEESKKDDQRLCKQIERLPNTSIFILLETDESGEFKRFCERHRTLWHHTLVYDQYHGEEMPALIPGEKSSTLDQYIGRFFLEKWMEELLPSFLDKACEMHALPALAVRCNDNLELLAAELAANKSEQKIKELQEKIINDLDHASNYHWAPGFMYSFFVYLQIAKLHETDVQIQNSFLLKALECVLMAVRLNNHPLSLSLLKDHGLKNKIKISLEEEGLAKFEDAENMLLGRLQIDKESKEYKDTIENVEKRLAGSKEIIEAEEQRVKRKLDAEQEEAIKPITNSKELLAQILKSETRNEHMRRLYLLYKVEELNDRWLESRDKEFEIEDKKIRDEIEALPEAMVFALFETAEKPDFRIFCERHVDLWHESLVADEFHGHEVPALILEKKCSNLDQYIGRYLLKKWDEAPDYDFLDNACDQHIFLALAGRCKINTNLLADELAKIDRSDSKIKELEDQITNDLNQLGNYYWGPGFIYGYYGFMNLAKLHHTDIHSEEDNAEIQIENGFLLHALESEQMAARLFQHPLSQEILKDHGFAELLEKFMQNNDFSKFDDAEEMILERLHIDKTSNLFKATIKKVEKRLSDSKDIIEGQEELLNYKSNLRP